MPIYRIEQDGKIYTIEAESEEGAYAVLDEEVGAIDGPVDEEAGSGVGTTMVGGLGALGALALLKKFPGPVGKAAGMLNTIRQQLMLSGYAGPKSILGGIGAHIERAG